MEAKKNNLDLPPAEIAKKIDASSHLDVLERMVVEFKSHPLTKDMLFEKMKDFRLSKASKDAVAVYYLKKRADLEQTIEDLVSSKKLNYPDLLRSSYDFSKNIDIDDDLNRLYRQILDQADKDKVGMHVEVPHQHVVDEISSQISEQSLPIAFDSRFFFNIFIPSWDMLGFKDFNRMHGIPIAYLGLTSEPVSADGITFSPERFLRHDAAHSSLKFKDASDIFAKVSKKHGWNSSFTSYDYSFKKSDIDQLIRIGFSKTKIYQDYSKAIKGFDRRKRLLAESIFFYNDHETGALNQSTYEELVKFLKNEFKNPESNTRGTLSSANEFAKRYQSDKDFSQAFRKSDLPITEKDILDVIDALPNEVTP